MKKLLIPTFALGLVGCASVLTQEAKIVETPVETGTVMISMESDSGFRGLSFSKINPQTCHVTHTTTLDGLYDDRITSGDVQLVEQFEPGVWILEETVFVDGKKKTITKYENGTYAFRVKAGDFIQVGKLNLSVGVSDIATPDQTEMDQYMADHPGLRAAPTAVSPWITPFSNSSDQLVIGCNPLPADYV